MSLSTEASLESNQKLEYPISFATRNYNSWDWKVLDFMEKEKFEDMDDEKDPAPAEIARNVSVEAFMKIPYERDRNQSANATGKRGGVSLGATFRC